MTRIQFNGPFLQLMRAYEVKLSPGQQDSFFEALRTNPEGDWLVAVTRIPGQEIKTHYKPFPTAAIVQQYVTAAADARIASERRRAPTVQSVLRASLALDLTPEEHAWAKLCATMIRGGAATRSAREARHRLAETFRREHHAWLDARPEIREWLEDCTA